MTKSKIMAESTSESKTGEYVVEDNSDSCEFTSKEDLRNIPRGQPKSGRPWKTLRDQRYSEIKKVKPLKTSWDQKVQDRASRKAVKLREKEMKETRAKELEEKRKRQEEHKKRKLENEKKNEILQTIKNPAKIKRMRKKQLRQIEKR